MSFRSALSLRMLGMYVPRAVTDSSAVSLAHVCCCAMLSAGLIFTVGYKLVFRESASVPGRVYARSRSPGSSTRLCAVIHLCEGQWESRAARRRRRAGGPLPMGGQPKSWLCVPWSSRGSVEGPYPRLSGLSAEASLRLGADGSPPKKYSLGHGRCLRRALTLVEGAFGRPPQDLVILETSPA